MESSSQGSSLAINPLLAMQLATASPAQPSGFAPSEDEPDPFVPSADSYSSNSSSLGSGRSAIPLTEPQDLYDEPDPIMATPTAELIAEAAATGRPMVPSASAPVSSNPPSLVPAAQPSSPSLVPSQGAELEPTPDHRKTAGWLIFLPLAAAGAAGGLAAAMTKKPVWIGAAAATAALATAGAGYIIKE